MIQKVQNTADRREVNHLTMIPPLLKPMVLEELNNTSFSVLKRSSRLSPSNELHSVQYTEKYVPFDSSVVCETAPCSQYHLRGTHTAGPTVMWSQILLVRYLFTY
ncbi:uncharacterized protein LOC135098424 isoform X2 [Scylla paramamosain]|uniref:uncharacterized protein LOC135098424 isoform X2 n=1 Tax=Scylla paramamosain TaxID=85552 RepID=UPI003083E612